MEFKGIERKEAGKFITRYDITYKTKDDEIKVYEMISRDKNLTEFAELHDRPSDAVVIIMHDRDNSRVLVNKEFRLAVGEPVYNFPAGLIDPGENAEQAARRELWEETGLSIVEIKDFLGESYSAVGFSNEKNVCVIGVAEGEFRESTSSVEEIEPFWLTREEVRKLLKTEKFAARTQAYLYVWSRGW